MDRASRKKSRGMEPYAPPPAAGDPPSGRTGGRGSVGLGPVHGLVHVEGVDLQAVYLGGAGEGEVIPVQGDDVGVVIHLLLNVAVHLHALIVVHLRLGGHVEGVQLLVVQAGVEALGLIVVHGPAHHAGGILVVVHPLENGGLVALRAVLVGQGGGLQKLDVAGEAGLVHLGLDEGGNLLIEGGAGADGQGKLHGLGVAGIGQHLLGGVGSVLGHLQIGVSSTLCKFVLLPYLKEFIRQNPHISISINCQSTNETLDLLDENKIDIGLIGKPDNLKNINFYYLDNIEDIFVANPDYLSNLKKRGITRDSILGNSTLMLLDKHNMTRQYIDDYLQDNHISVAESIDISNMDLLIDFAKIGVGVACVIKSFVTKELQEGSLVEIPLGIPIHKREIGFAYKENLKPSKSLQTFIDFYRTYRPEETL